MRWKKQPEPQHNEKRIKRGFLFFPKRINLEWRWLEIAEWNESYYDSHTRWFAYSWKDES